MRSALLVIDIINRFDYPGAAALLAATRRIVPAIVSLRRRARAAGCPIVYCNDNFGQWRSDLGALVARCTEDGAPGRDLVERLRPDPSDYFVLKPRHSAFYQTPLEILLERLKARRLILAGIAGESCIHATAVEGHVREYDIVVVADATASQTAARQRRALRHLEDTRSAKVRSARGVRF